jgi:hypothetical integral membrane protein (TIGR02206 family)
MDNSPFILFGPAHGAAVLATIAGVIFMVRLNRSATIPVRFKRAANTALAVVLVISVGMDPLLTWLRYRDDPAEAAQLLRENSLPFHLCDIVSLILAVALITRRQRLAELGYLWGVAGTLQGVITPAVKFDWHSPEYYAFFAQHGGVQAAALGLVLGAGLTPQPGAFRRVMLWSWTYMAAAFTVNALLHTNYGYMNGKPEAASLLDHLGPWPWYLLSLQGVAFVFFGLLLLPFRRRHGKGHGIH